METQPVRQEPDTNSSPASMPVSLLDTMSTSGRSLSPARKRFKRMYHRVRSGLEKDGNVRMLTLTSSEIGTERNFQRDFRRLIKRLQRRNLVLSYIRVPELTRAGSRHDHILFRGSYIDQRYLSYLWGEIHYSPVVDIRRIRGSHRLACYLANYLAKSPAGRYSYSWSWVWKGFAKSWQGLKKYAKLRGYNFSWLLTFWQNCVRTNVRVEELIPI